MLKSTERFACLHRNKLSKNRYLLYLWLISSIYIAFNIATQRIVSSTVIGDQAEQLIFSQDWKLGYTAQPPLYTWIVNIIFCVTGSSSISLLGLKVVLLSLFVAILILIGHQFSFTLRQQIVSIVSFALLPQYIWELQRVLTHSLLVTVMAAATLLQVIRTQRNPTKFNYGFIGIFAGMGFISKYNFAIFLLALGTALVLTDRYREVINSYRILISVALAVTILAPHTFWVLNNIDTATGSINRLEATGTYHFESIFTPLLSGLIYLTPFWIFLLFFFKRSSGKLDFNQQNDWKFIRNLFSVTIILVLLFAQITGAQAIKPHWYLPLLFYVPLFIGLRTNVSRKIFRSYCLICIAAALTVSIALPSRTLFAEGLNDMISQRNDSNIPYPTLAKKLVNSIHEEPLAIFAETKTIGGNFQPFFKNTRILTPAYDGNLTYFDQPGKGLILCETQNCKSDIFKNWIQNKYNIDLNLCNFKIQKSRYYYISSKEFTIYWAEVSILKSAV